jgi:hypothetical protein
MAMDVSTLSVIVQSNTQPLQYQGVLTLEPLDFSVLFFDTYYACLLLYL